MYYIYVLRCEDGSLYTGITTDMERRIKEHLGKDGKGAAYTKMHPPRGVAALFCCAERRDALRLEWRIKRLKKAEKECLCEDNTLLGQLIGDIDASLYSPVLFPGTFQAGE